MPFSWVSIVDFEQVNVSWEVSTLTYQSQQQPLKKDVNHVQS